MVRTAALVLGLVASLAGTLIAEDAFPPEAFGVVPGHATGVLVLDGELQHFLGRTGPEGREVSFSTAGQSYRWVLVPGRAGDVSPTLNLRGQKAGDFYAPAEVRAAGLADDMAALGLQKPYALVEAEVNEGLGSREDERLVLTKIKPLEGSPGYPADLSAVVDEAREAHERLPSLTPEMEKARTAPATPPPPWFAKLGGGGAEAVRDDRTLVYVTWLPDTRELVVRFRRMKVDVRSVPVKTKDGEIYRHTQWAVQRDFTATWKGGKLHAAASAPAAFHFELNPEAGN